MHVGRIADLHEPHAAHLLGVDSVFEALYANA